MGVADQLRIDVRREPDRMIVTLAGELDMASADVLQRALTAAEDVQREPMIVLDLEQLEFIDSTGLRSILAACERCRERQQEFAITPGSPQVQRLLEISGAAGYLSTSVVAGDLGAARGAESSQPRANGAT
jgi:anti-sigma B factor antagonist